MTQPVWNHYNQRWERPQPRPPIPPKRGMPTWAIVAIVLGGIFAVLFIGFVTIGIIAYNEGPTEAEAAKGCQESISTIASGRGIYTTYDPESVTTSTNRDGTFDVYGEVRASVSGYNYTTTLTYQCGGMSPSDSGKWIIPSRSLS